VSGGVGGEVKIATALVHPEKVIDDPYMASNTPIYQTATFGQPSATTFGPYDYTRSGNPTRTVLEKQMAALEGAHGAWTVWRVSCVLCVCVCVWDGTPARSLAWKNANSMEHKAKDPTHLSTIPPGKPFNDDVPTLPHGSLLPD